MLQKQKKLRDEGKGEQMTKYFFKKGQQLKKKRTAKAKYEFKKAGSFP